MAKPSEFKKSEKGWLKYQGMVVNLYAIDEQALLNHDEVVLANKEIEAVNDTSKSIDTSLASDRSG